MYKNWEFNYKINFFHDKESEIDSDEENKKPKLEEGAETDSDEKNKKPNLEIIKEILSKYNHIYIIDDGTGMTGEILSTVWMNIGTSDKEKNTTSKKGRQKTGAKGIGRFALDKLSTATEVYTRQKDDSLYRWSLNWELFENSEFIDDVKAELDIIDDKTMGQIAETFIKSNDNRFIDFEIILEL